MLKDNQDNLIRNDYEKALVHLVWQVFYDENEQKSVRYLIFGMVEAFPREIDAAEFQCEEVGVKFNRCGRFYYIRTVMPINEALDWYKNGINKGTFPITWEDSKDEHLEKDIQTFGLYSFTPWPMFSLTNSTEIPFINPAFGTVRIHSAFPVYSPEFHEKVQRKDIANWVNSHLAFPIIDDTSLFLGSIHLVLANPLFRQTRQRQIPPKEGQKNEVQVTIIPRENVSVDSLRETLDIYHIEENFLGKFYRPCLIPEKICALEFKIPLANKNSKSALIVYCKERGLLGIDEPRNFLKTMKLEFAIKECTFMNTLHDKSSGLSYHSNVDKYIKLISTIGEEIDAFDPGVRLVERKLDDELAKEAIKYGQEYLQEPIKAREYIVEKILYSAEKNITIVDPYFTDDDMIYFTPNNRFVDISVTIVLGKDGLKRKSAIDGCSGKKVFEVINEKVKEFKNKKVQNTISIKVMTESKIFHDRFIIIDDKTVWFSGNSLNNLGKRKSMILKLPDPRPVISDVKEILEKGEHIHDFWDWLKETVEASNDGESA